MNVESGYLNIDGFADMADSLKFLDAVSRPNGYG